MKFSNLSIPSILVILNVIQLLKFLFVLAIIGLSIFVFFNVQAFKSFTLQIPLLCLYIGLAMNITFFGLFFLEQEMEELLFLKYENIEVYEEEM